MMHRDLKTDNIFISNNIAKIGDFGFATREAYTDSAIGTPLYCSPNQIENFSR